MIGAQAGIVDPEDVRTGLAMCVERPHGHRPAGRGDSLQLDVVAGRVPATFWSESIKKTQVTRQE
jgi:hypothetical protein